MPRISQLKANAFKALLRAAREFVIINRRATGIEPLAKRVVALSGPLPKLREDVYAELRDLITPLVLNYRGVAVKAVITKYAANLRGIADLPPEVIRAFIAEIKEL